MIIKNSHSHPLNISWILPLSSCTCSNGLSSSSSSIVASSKVSSTLPAAALKQVRKRQSTRQEIQKTTFTTLDMDKPTNNSDTSDNDNDNDNDEYLLKKIKKNKIDITTCTVDDTVIEYQGNLALSSLPGKKVRLESELEDQDDQEEDGKRRFNKKLPVSRDLNTDFKRISQHGIHVIVNLLDDSELELLQTPWKEYEKQASSNGISVIRYPITEGNCPGDIETFQREVVGKINAYTKHGKNVLVHCRGGIGRAGLVASCWLLSNGYAECARDAIEQVRMRRSLRAIETKIQVYFQDLFSKD